MIKTNLLALATLSIFVLFGLSEDVKESEEWKRQALQLLKDAGKEAFTKSVDDDGKEYAVTRKIYADNDSAVAIEAAIQWRIWKGRGDTHLLLAWLKQNDRATRCILLLILMGDDINSLIHYNAERGHEFERWAKRFKTEEEEQRIEEFIFVFENISELSRLLKAAIEDHVAANDLSGINEAIKRFALDRE